MSEKHNPPVPYSSGVQLPPWLVIALLFVALGISWWKSSHSEVTPPRQSIGEPVPEAVQSDQPHRSTASRSQSKDPEESSYQVKEQTIRDLNGKVVYEGTIDLKPTLDRIERGGSNRHRNDGTNFQNREGRLPRKSHGYYKEYVHPTPGEHGPGPQRIIIGQDGDIWYTPDHYQTFIEIKKP